MYPCAAALILTWLRKAEICNLRLGDIKTPERETPTGIEMVTKASRIPDDVLKEIFPKRFNKSLATNQIYTRLRQMILSGKLEKGQKLLQEKGAQDFRVSRVTVGIAFSQLKKDRLIISKRGTGSYIRECP